MLVGAFEIEVGRPALVGPMAALQREHMGAAAVEPDVEDVGDHLVIVGVAVAEEGGGIRGVPRVDALLAEGGDDARVDFAVDQQLAGLPLDEQSDRHAPRALAADHPVGPPLDHRAEAVAALLRHEAGVGDRLHRELAQASPSPLRGGGVGERGRLGERQPPLPARLRCRSSTLSPQRGEG